MCGELLTNAPSSPYDSRSDKKQLQLQSFHRHGLPVLRVVSWQTTTFISRDLAQRSVLNAAKESLIAQITSCRSMDPQKQPGQIQARPRLVCETLVCEPLRAWRVGPCVCGIVWVQVTPSAWFFETAATQPKRSALTFLVEIGSKLQDFV